MSGGKVKPSLSWEQQSALLVERGLSDADRASELFLQANNYYRFSGYARYFQRAPHTGDNRFKPGTTFADVRRIYDDDQAVREMLIGQLACVEVLLRAHTAYVIGQTYGAYGHYLDEAFYTDVGDRERTLDACLRDLERSKERHILRFSSRPQGPATFERLPVWSAVEAWSFGTLSKCIERGARGTLANDVANSLGVAKSGFAYRVRALVYLRNRCAHHSRLWHHSVIDAGPTPNNVRVKAKRVAGQFEPRSVLDVVASLDDLLVRSRVAEPLLPAIVIRYRGNPLYWQGLCHPQQSVDG
ncbi:Abi family protein [Oryzobacter telluris]|uniref:Abi family protein n=1 Tax=Oryzobacter telluris TaxID=3149179 RepID=UPI00370D502A